MHLSLRNPNVHNDLKLDRYDTYLALLQKNVATVTAWGDDPPYPQYGPDHIIMMTDMDGSWHGGQAYEDKRYNVLFCDGHVHFTTRDELSELWDEKFTPQPGP
jgi:prepilin-type processing-associated H-X9-DG protein